MLRPLRWRLRLTVAPDRVTFADRDSRADVAPLVRLAADGKLVELGEAAAAPGQGGRLVRLFDGHVRDGSWTEEDALTAFFRYHLLRHNERFPLRPAVELQGASAFGHLMAGREREIFTRSLLRAGAAEVIYLDLERQAGLPPPAA